MAKEIAYRHPKWTAYSLSEVFGDDDELTNLLEKKIKKLSREYKKILKFVPVTNPNLSWVKSEVNRLIAEREYGDKIKIYERVLFLITQPKDAPQDGRGVTDMQIERARAVPITDFIEFTRGFASCPWHVENTGSLHIIPGTEETKAHCHGACSKTYDAIAAYQLLHNCNFITAVKALAP